MRRRPRVSRLDRSPDAAAVLRNIVARDRGTNYNQKVDHIANALKGVSEALGQARLQEHGILPR